MSSTLTGKALILATKPFAKEVRWKSWLYTISTLVILLALFAGTIWNIHWSLKILCSILAGLTVGRMFVIYHDHQHHAILDKSIPAKIIMNIFGLYMLAPTSIWKRSHDYHHKHNSRINTADIGSFPIMRVDEYQAASASEKRQYLFARHPITIAFGYFSMFFFGMCYNSFRSSPSRHFDSLVAMILHVAAGICIYIFAGWMTFLLTWSIPFFIAGGFGAYLFYAQHNFPGVTFTNKEGWTYEGAAMESSSYMRMNFLMRWFTANIGYHHVHHLNSRIPFYRLPEAMHAIPELQKAKETSLHPREIWRCLRLKFWDEKQNRMIEKNEHPDFA